MRSRKRIIIVSVIVFITSLILGFCALQYDNKKNEDAEVIIKDNVRVITSDAEHQPISVEENKIIFSTKQKYAEGDVIVAGIIDTAPNGFIRKVINVEKVNEKYIYETEYAVLTDVFEELHIVRCFALEEDDVYETNALEMNNKKDKVLEMSCSEDEEYKLQAMSYTASSQSSMVLLESSPIGFLFQREFEEEISDNAKMEGSAIFASWIEVKIDIEDGEIEFGIVSHTTTNGKLSIEWGEKFEKGFSKEIFRKSLPNIEFMIGYVPVVITNECAILLDAKTTIEGSMGAELEIGTERIIGFEYLSRTGKIVEINENNYLSDGLEWKVASSVSGQVSGGVSAHLITKLYGCTGADVAMGIDAEILGEASVAITDGEPTIYGSLELSVAPRVQGSLVVEIPVIDKKLTECELFDVKLQPFWERKWENTIEFSENEENNIESIEKNAEEGIVESVDNETGWNRCHMILTSQFVDRGNYYSVTGIVGANLYVPVETAEQIEVGGEYSVYGRKFVYKGKVPYSSVSGSGSTSINGMQVTEYHLFEDEFNEKYYTYAQPEMANAVSPYGMPSYLMYAVEYNNPYFLYNSMVTLAENYELRIRKDVTVWIVTKEPIVNEDLTSLSSEAFTLEECIKEKIADYKGNVFAETRGMVIDVSFDDEGNCDYLFVEREVVQLDETNLPNNLASEKDFLGDLIVKRGSEVDGWSVIEYQSTSDNFGFSVDDCYQTASGVYVVSDGWVCKVFDAEGNGTHGQYALWSIGECGNPYKYSDSEYAPVEGEHFWKLN